MVGKLASEAWHAGTSVDLHVRPVCASLLLADFAHLTKLAKLSYSAPADSHFTVALPAQLQWLQLFGPIEELSGHKGLHSVDLQSSQTEDLSVLRSLAAIPSDWCLEINLEHDKMLLPDQQQDPEGYEGALDVQVRKL